MRITSVITYSLSGWIVAICVLLVSIYISIGWTPICNRLTFIGFISAVVLLIITLAHTEADENDGCDCYDFDDDVEFAGQCVQTYLDCSEEFQESIRDMLNILNDPKTDEDEYYMSLATLAEALDLYETLEYTDWPESDS